MKRRIFPFTVVLKLSLVLLSATLLVSACVTAPLPTPDPLLPTIAALQTEQAGLQSILARTPAPTVTQLILPTQQPTATPTILPSPTPVTGFLGLSQALYFLAPDENELDQVWRLEPDGSTRTRLTHETRSLKEFDISGRGDLAYVVWDTPEGSPRLILQPGNSSSPQVLVELNAAGEFIKNVRWLPNAHGLVFHRSIVIGDATSPESTLTASELVLYNLPDSSLQVLLRAGPDPVDPVVGTQYTNESLEYDAGNQWQMIYQVTTISSEGRFLLLNDTGGPFWLVYDLLTNSVYRYNIRANSGDINPNGQFVCLAGVTDDPNYLGKQALLCADMLANAVNTFLTTPPWQPFGLDYWPADNAVVFLQLSGSGENSLLQVYGMNLDGTEPLLLRQENFSFSDAQAGPREALYFPQDNQANGLVVLTGQTPAMDAPGLVIIPLDATKPVQLVKIGPVRQPRWGPVSFP